LQEVFHLGLLICKHDHRFPNLLTPCFYNSGFLVSDNTMKGVPSYYARCVIVVLHD